MRTRQASPGAACLLVAAMIVPVPRSGGQEPVPSQLVPLAAREGHCECVLPSSPASEKYYLIVSSLARTAGPFIVTVRTEATSDPVCLPVQVCTPDPAWLRQVREVHGRLDRLRAHPAARDPYLCRGAPPPSHAFDIFVKEGQFDNPANYVRVTGLLQAVGRYCQVYVDHDCPDLATLRPTLDETVRTFDEEVYPLARERLGQALDVDRDGRFTILFTPWLSKLSSGKVSLGGFVRGSDWDRDLAAPFGNRCDMMYLNTDLRPGPHLRSLLAHEYTHAVIFSEHVFGNYLAEVPRQDEESWLNEALAHMAEDLHGYGWTNLDYRISAFLSAPERYQLVVADYYGTGLWRSPGHRGAAYLFVRWCADVHGADLPARLIQTNLAGVSNLEVTTQESFVELFRRWSAALLVSGMNLAGEAVPPLRRLDPRRALGGRFLGGPRFMEMRLTQGQQQVSLAGTSSAYFLLHSPAGERSRLTVVADAGAALQVSLLRLPPAMARLELRCEPDKEAGSVRLILTAHDAAVTLDAATWERLIPTGIGHNETSYQPGATAGQQAAAWFGCPRLHAGETRTSVPLLVDASAKEGNPILFKIAATDAAGHRIAAWAVLAI
jgi:hypothetical protein